MMNAVNITYVTIITVLSFICTVDAIKCFQCSSYEHPECADIPPNTTESSFLRTCQQRGDYEMFCRKIIQTVLDAPRFTRITRSCGYYRQKNGTNCIIRDTDFKLEKSCECFTDACNYSTKSTTVPSILITTLLIFANYLINY